MPRRGVRYKTISDSANELGVPLVRSDAFVYEEEGVGIVLLLDSDKLIVVRAEERFLPVEFVSGSLHACARGEVKREIPCKQLEASYGRG